MMSKRCAFIFFALWAMVCQPSVAQDFNGWAQVGPVPQTGYYRVQLPPQVLGRLQPQAQDLRLFSPTGKEVPYIIQVDNPASYTRTPIQAFTRTDSAKKTILRLEFGQPMYPEQVKFFISGPSLFHRTATIILGKEKVYGKRRFKRRRRSRLQEIAVQTVLQSTSANLVELPRHSVDKLVIEIVNADNPPLVIDSMLVLQQTHYLVAHLEAVKHYSLAFGDEKVSAPEYDLVYFKDRLPLGLPVAPLSNIKVFAGPDAKGSATSSRVFIWAAIAVVAIGLGFMTRQLLRDMDRKT